ncbi:hypothetical protein Q7A53_05465 [Halobacillus rhizosphaerae]|uniref:hypothetical protein n=1 Tax=Halobacillus rhizosphaerae TaxID=3064889 RepID=UPI00398A9047
MCGLDDTLVEDMEFELVGKKRPLKKYYHKLCYQERLKQKEFQAVEEKQLDDLRICIQKIYGVDPLPEQAYPFLQKIRNGEPALSGQKTGKRYKEGYPYPVIQETFEFCADTIRYWNGEKGFESFTSAFKYALRIILDKLYVVDQRIKDREEQEMRIKKQPKIVQVEEDYESSYKKQRKDKVELSDFLDD